MNEERMFKWTLIGLILMFAAFLLSGCKSTQYVPVETVRTEYIDRQHRDSIHITDSVYIREKGDTVWLTRWRTEYKDRLVRDSILIWDSIQVPFPVEVPVEVEKKLSWWENLKMNLGGMALGALLLVITYLVFKIIKTVKSAGWRGLFSLIKK